MRRRRKEYLICNNQPCWGLSLLVSQLVCALQRSLAQIAVLGGSNGESEASDGRYRAAKSCYSWQPLLKALHSLPWKQLCGNTNAIHLHQIWLENMVKSSHTFSGPPLKPGFSLSCFPLFSNVCRRHTLSFESAKVTLPSPSSTSSPIPVGKLK